jgi:hypothetical protein
VGAKIKNGIALPHATTEKGTPENAVMEPFEAFSIHSALPRDEP